MRSWVVKYVFCHVTENGTLLASSACIEELSRFADASLRFMLPDIDQPLWRLRRRFQKLATVRRESWCHYENEEAYALTLGRPEGPFVSCSQLPGYNQTHPIRHIRVLLSVDIAGATWRGRRTYPIWCRSENPDIARRRQLLMNELRVLKDLQAKEAQASRAKIEAALDSLDQLTAVVAAQAFRNSARVRAEDEAAQDQSDVRAVLESGAAYSDIAPGRRRYLEDLISDTEARPEEF
jgi:hypothetical protein